MGIFFSRERGPTRGGPVPFPMPWDCRSQLVHGLLPPFLGAALGVSPRTSGTVTAGNLHPFVSQCVRSLLAGESLNLDYQTPSGRNLVHAIREPRFEGKDFRYELGLTADGRTLFKGQVRVAGARARGKVSLAASVFGAIEVLYGHLAEQMGQGAPASEMRVGVISATGVIEDAATLAPILASTLTPFPGEKGPGFHSGLGFGLFPSEGFGHFHGPGFVLQDEPLG